MGIGLLLQARGRAQDPDHPGILELATSTDVRPLVTPVDLVSFLPERGRFTFPAPYNTIGARLTNAHDCGDWYDCVNGAGGASWRNMNNSAGSNVLYIVLGLDKTNGGAGPSLFRYDKTTGETVNLGGLFDPDDDRTWGNLDGWYFSPSLPTKFYIGLDAELTRYDVLTHTTSVVFDITDQFGDDKEVYHAQSSKDDRVHSFTLRLINNREQLGCGVFREDTQQFSYFPGVGAFHECQVDQSGQWLLIKEDRDNTDGEDDRIVNLYTGAETVLLRTAGAAGPSDNGYGSMVALDATAALPSALRTWTFGPLTPGPIVYHSLAGLPPSFTQVSFANARSAALDQQFACGGAVNRTNGPRANEIACVRLDGSLTTLTLAPTMTDLDALGGGPNDDVIKQPLGTLDPTGQFFLWTTNLLGDRIDAFLVHVPPQVLVTTPADTTVPVVAITAPADAATVFGTAALTVAASDDTAVAGVQFQLDGASLGAELTTGPFAWNWDTTTTADGVHVLTAVARDAAGNFTVSLPVSITVLNSPDAPQISDVAATGVIERLATVRWRTNQLADSSIEYGPTTAYEHTTAVNPALTATHLQTLTGLTPGTTYHYRVISKNPQNVIATSADFTFTTQSAPAITAVEVSAITTTSATISWTTDLPSDTMIEWGFTTGYGDATNPDEAFVTAHVQGLYNLQPGARYYFRVYSVTPEGVLSKSTDFTFSTVGAPAISGLNVSAIGLTTATIGWTTDNPANTVVDYGLTTAYGGTTGADGTFVLTHGRTLTGLTAGTMYHYRVSSTNIFGLGAASDDATFTTADINSVLVVSPHPDDDLLIAAGIISRAVSQGADVRIVYVTNGDACCTPYGVGLGLMREDEAVSGQSVLGVAEDNLLFLGYPDSYLNMIRTQFPNADQVLTTLWNQTTTYAGRGLGRTDWHTYHFGAPASYNGANIRLDLTSILQTYRPDDIYTTAEFDIHGDHSSTYTFVKQALDDAMAADATYRPILHKSVVHMPGPLNEWPGPANPQAPFTEPPGLAGTGVTWADREHVDVPLAMQNPDLSVNPKALALATHASQGGVNGFLGSFLRRDEFFWEEISTTPTAVLSVTPLSVAFGTAIVNTTASRTLTIANTGSAALTIYSIGTPAEPFGMTDLPPVDTVIAPGGSLTTGVTFIPVVATAATAFVVVESSAGNEIVNLTGTGVLTQEIPSPAAGGWQLNGDAAIVGPVLQLTAASAFQRGSAFWPTPVPSSNLTVDFDATITGGNGADGMTFAMIDPAAGATALGNTGGALGFSPLAGVAVTLDTYQNGNDPSSNFVGIATGYTGTADTLAYAATSTAVPNLQSGTHHFTVTTRDGHLAVRIDGTLYLDQVVALPGSVLVGFTGATGGLTNQHMVANVSVIAEDPTPAPMLAVTTQSVDFGSAAVATTTSQTITITNIGNAPMTITAITAPSAPFDAAGLPAAGSVIATGNSITATLTFTPSTAGLANGSLVLETNGGSVTIALVGTGSVPPPPATVTAVTSSAANGALSSARAPW